jgi:hypothetical protein
MQSIDGDANVNLYSVIIVQSCNITHASSLTNPSDRCSITTNATRFIYLFIYLTFVTRIKNALYRFEILVRDISYMIIDA